jgi:hypothetical protein
MLEKLIALLVVKDQAGGQARDDRDQLVAAL